MSNNEMDRINEYESTSNYISIIAQSFYKQSLLQPSHFQNLKRTLEEYPHLRSHFGQQPLLSYLEQCKDPAFVKISELIGRVALIRNLLRHDLKHSCSDLQVHIFEFGRFLSKKSELYFNRPFNIHYQGKCLHVTTHAAVLLELNQRLKTACEELDRIHSSLSGFVIESINYRDMRREGFLESLRADLGCTRIDGSGLPYGLEIECLERYRFALRQLVSASQAYLTLASATTPSKGATLTEITLESLLARIEQPKLHGLISSDQLEAWEIRRSSIVNHVIAITCLLQQSFESLQLLIEQNNAVATGKASALNFVVRKTLMAKLLDQGLDPLRAVDAAEHFSEYCNQRGIQPSQVLEGEIKKIHQDLDSDSLKLAQQSEQDFALASFSHFEKSNHQKTLQSLKAFFNNSGVVALFVALIASVLVSSCGLKALPRSEFDDIRPEIPLRPKDPLSPKKKSHDAPSPYDHWDIIADEENADD